MRPCDRFKGVLVWVEITKYLYNARLPTLVWQLHAD